MSGKEVTLLRCLSRIKYFRTNQVCSVVEVYVPETTTTTATTTATTATTPKPDMCPGSTQEFIMHADMVYSSNGNELLPVDEVRNPERVYNVRFGHRLLFCPCLARAIMLI